MVLYQPQIDKLKKLGIIEINCRKVIISRLEKELKDQNIKFYTEGVSLNIARFKIKENLKQKRR